MTNVRQKCGVSGVVLRFQAIDQFCDARDVVDVAYALPRAPDIAPGLGGAAVEAHLCFVRFRQVLGVEAGGRQVLAGPMIAFGRATGAVWVEAAAAAALDQGHLRLLLVIAALAAVAREESREAARLQESKERLQAEINLEHNMVGRSQPMRFPPRVRGTNSSARKVDFTNSFYCCRV